MILRIDYRKFRDFSLLAYIMVIVLLFGVVTPFGSSAKGAQAWYAFPGGFQFQPSEIAKFLLIVALCGYVNEHRGDIDPWRVTMIVTLAIVPIGLVQLQPDLGTNMVFAAILVGLLAVAGAKGRYLLVLLLLAATGVYAVISLGAAEAVPDRPAHVGHQTPTTATPDRGLQRRTSRRRPSARAGSPAPGCSRGPQTRLGYVPEQHTDFIFTAVGEELGFVGAAALLALFAIVMWRTWRTARLARDYYGTLVCSAVFAMFAFQIFENIGMTMGIMPVTGIPLAPHELRRFQPHRDPGLPGPGRQRLRPQI